MIIDKSLPSSGWLFPMHVTMLITMFNFPELHLDPDPRLKKKTKNESLEWFLVREESSHDGNRVINI